MKGNFHVRFGERGGETHWLQDQKVRSAPTLRSGGMFVQSAHFVERMNANPSERLTFYGLEKNATTIRLAKMNLAVQRRPA
ncbi:MAG: methyltransferase [Bacteroidetes bacterium]|nr:methyltransferase [Bacteroidota bacterium]